MELYAKRDETMRLSKKQHLYYDIIMSTLAVGAALIAFIDISQGLNEWQQLLDHVLWLIFSIDYIIRFRAAPKKSVFIKTNICDLVAIIPFYTIFRAFRLQKVMKSLKFLKFPRIIAFLYRPLRKAKRFLNTNGFKYVVFVTVIMIGAGGVLIHFAEGMSYGDGLWWAFVTATTVGYGDISPTTLYGRIIATVLMLLGIGLIGTVTSTLTSYFLKIQDKSTKNQVIDIIKNKLEHLDELSDDEVEDICSTIKGLHRKKH